jgi:hypothetical protein
MKDKPKIGDELLLISLTEPKGNELQQIAVIDEIKQGGKSGDIVYGSNALGDRYEAFRVVPASNYLGYVKPEGKWVSSRWKPVVESK